MDPSLRPPPSPAAPLHPAWQVYDECPTAGSRDCLENTTRAVGCSVASVAGRVGSSYVVRLEGPQSISGTVEYDGDGLFTVDYVGPVAGVYELHVSDGIGTLKRRRNQWRA